MARKQAKGKRRPGESLTDFFKRMGKTFGGKGGRATALTMSPAERSARMKAVSKARWDKLKAEGST